MKAPTIKDLLTEAAGKGYEFKKTGTVNFETAWKLKDAQKHGYAADPTGLSAMLFTKYTIADLLGYQL
jgi:hypothetical protein